MNKIRIGDIDMKKIIIVGIFSILLLSSAVTLPAMALKTQVKRNDVIQLNCNDGAKLEIEILKNFCASIRNVGDEDAINVKWKICLQAPFLFIGGGCQDGTIEKIKAGAEETVCYRVGLLIGFGPLIMKVTASADNAEEVTKSKLIGFILGPLILTP
jgi:hypothetical protein